MPLSYTRRRLPAQLAAVAAGLLLAALPSAASPALAEAGTPTQDQQFSRIAAGPNHTVWVAPDGRVAATGSNSTGQLGDGTTTDRLGSVWVAGLTNVVAVSAGFSHSLALDADGNVWAWGRNNAGQLGDGTTTDRLAPVQVTGLTGVTAISAGSAHNLALDASGQLFAWGHGGQGQLGTGTTGNRTAPTAVSGPLGEVVAFSAGEVHSLAVDAGGAAWAWGFNSFGHLGNGTIEASTVPVPVDDTNLTGVVAVAAGGNAGQGHSLALDATGTVWAWGNNSDGQLGDGSFNDSLVPVPVTSPDLTGAVTIAAGAWHSLAIDGDGTAWAWGNNQNGQLGDGTTTRRSVPAPVEMSSMFQAHDIGAGSGVFHTVAIEDFGPGSWAPWAWGGNRDGQLGTGSTDSFHEPVPMNLPVG